MQNRLLQLLGSYDLFGKSVPGAIFLSGIILLLPRERIPVDQLSELDVLNIAALFIILLIAGLTIGQGVHTLADNIEKTFLWFARRLRNMLNLIRVTFDFIPAELHQWKASTDKTELRFRIVVNWWNNSIEWIRRRYWGGYDSLVSHRHLFVKWIEWNYSRENEDRWPTGSKGEAFDHFVAQYQNRFDVDLRRKAPSEIAGQYPLITSHLVDRGRNQFRHFQALYSFCRSMWVVLFLLSITYTASLIDIKFIPNLFDHTPLVAELLGGKPLVLIGIYLVTFVFFDASGTYKRHFVEYLMASFANSVDNESLEQTPEQRDITDY